MDEKKLIEKLSEMMTKYGSIQAGNILGYDPSFLRKVIDGRKSITEGIVKALGYETVTTYKRIK